MALAHLAVPSQPGTVGPRLYRRGRVWWADLRLQDGTRHRLATGETDEAAARRRAAQLATEVDVPTASRHITLTDALEETYVNHWQGTRSDIIIRRVLDVISRQIGYLTLAEITYGRLEVYCKGLLQDGLKPATVNRRMSAVSMAITRAVRRGELAARPEFPHFRENNIKDKYITSEEEAAIMQRLDLKVREDALYGRTDYEYLRHLCIFLLDTGFRFSEAFVFTLDADHADLRNGTTKNNQGRRVPLTKRAKVAAQYLLSSPIHARLRKLPGKKPWDWVAHRFNLITRESNCSDITLHVLRHTCASRLVQRGVAIYVVSRWLGHSSVKVTERYAKLAPDSLSNALAALEGNP